MRRWIFRMLFSDLERVAIINALWRRSEDKTDISENPEDKGAIRYVCKNIATELMTGKNPIYD